MKYDDSEHKQLAQISSGCHGAMNQKCNEALEADLGADGTAKILNQAGPGSAQGSFYDPQQVKIAGMMGEGTAGTFGNPPHPPYTVDEANAQVEKWEKQGENVTATPKWVRKMGDFLETFGPVPLTQ
jgi:hypothetical protein